ncbi:single-stranded DNA-binding protein [Patescibacteria group bacterium]|nr:single-stranded DNA-binding protein [Patescibacteria group bacterium]
MRSVNKVILIGNLTRDPELRETPNGQKVTTFGLATNRAWTTQGGDKKQSAEFHECVAWANLAEISDKFLKKGNLVYVEGYLKTRSWEAEDGAKRFKTEVVVQDMIKLEKRSDNEEDDEYLPNTDEAEKTVEEPAEEPVEEPAETPSEDSTDENPIDKDLGL